MSTQKTPSARAAADVAENAVCAIDLAELLGILEHWRRHGDTIFARSSIAVAARRASIDKHIEMRDE